MIRFFKKPGRWTMVFTLALCAAFTFTLLDTFVFPKAYAETSEAESAAAAGSMENSGTEAPSSSGENAAVEGVAGSGPESQEAMVTASGYQDENISITVETLTEYNTTYYVADIRLSDASLLKTALAGGVYGRNIKETTSAIAEENNAIFAVNGDYYGFRDFGYVLRNGVLYRDTPGNSEALLIDANGAFSIVQEGEVSAQSLADAGAWQILSFGPALVKEDQVVVDENTEVSRSLNSNPRTAIGQVDELHYIFVVSDGRTSESAGLSLLQLAEIFAERGATTAYNLDGGGSATIVLNGEVLNNPTSGRSIGEREVSDIVYIGY